MTEPERVAPLAWIATKIDQNIWAILAAGLAAFAGHLTGTTTANHRLDVLEKQVARIERMEDEQDKFNVCAVRNSDRLHRETKIEPACPLQVPERKE